MGFPVKGVRRPGDALDIRIPKFPENLNKFGNVAGVDVDQVVCQGIMVAGTLVSDGFCGDNNAAVLNFSVQNAAVAQQNDPLGAHGDDVLELPHTGRRADSGLAEA